MIVSCPSCSTRYDVDASRLKGGRGRLRCARCNTLFAVEGEASTAPRAASPRLDVALVAMEPSEVRDLIVATLTSAAVRCVTAESGPSAAEIATRSRPRLAVLAFHLPGLLGPEIVRELRGDPALASMRIVLVGGPTHRAKYDASPSVVHDVDGHLPVETTEATASSLLRGLLGLPGGAIPAVASGEIEALASVVASDLALYHGDSVARARGGRTSPELDALLLDARRGCASRLPATRGSAASLEAFTTEVRSRLRQ